MAGQNIFTRDEVEARTVFHPKSGLRDDGGVSGERLQLVWAKLGPEGTYALHSHPYDQISMLVQGHMRLTVGDEVRDIGPGDMWHAPAGIEHGGEVLGDEPVMFIDVYSPPNKLMAERWAVRNLAE